MAEAQSPGDSLCSHVQSVLWKGIIWFLSGDLGRAKHGCELSSCFKWPYAACVKVFIRI